MWDSCIALTPAAKRAHNDVKGRLWDVLWMMRLAMQSNRDASSVLFEVYVVRKRVTPTRTRLKVVCGPGDDAEPVLTIMFPEED